jgi:hypothetical protein
MHFSRETTHNSLSESGVLEVLFVFKSQELHI